MSLKIEIPKSISICFVGGDQIRTDEQELMLRPLLEKFNVEFWRRCDKFTGFYASFSQIINEACNETNEEFIFFINPKVNPNPQEIEDMLIDLCSGFCWTSKIAFGLWGTTKELFRNIGLLDERFLGSEWEDVDFICRLKLFNKAIKWQYSLDLYPSKPSPINDLRGSSLTIFRNKWIEVGDYLYLDVSMSENKKIRSKASRDDISISWMDISNSILLDNNGIIGYLSKIIEIKNFKQDIIFTNSLIRLNINSEYIRVELLCDIKTYISIQVLNKNKELITYGVLLESNTWNQNVMFDNITDTNEIKIFHEGDKIYHNKMVLLPLDIDISIGLRITKKEIV
jgi:hypothetical protein